MTIGTKNSTHRKTDMPMYKVIRIARDAIEVEADSEEEAIDIACNDDFTTAVAEDTDWETELLPIKVGSTVTIPAATSLIEFYDKHRNLIATMRTEP
jgi:hypothetical protein